jgi:hypothetical protein
MVAALSLDLLRHLALEFDESSQLFIRVHNETPSVVAVCVSNPDRSPFPI